jgi:hypothetical protein
MSDRKTTQIFVIRDIITTYCDSNLTPDIVDKIMKEIAYEISKGPCSWAFEDHIEAM